MTYAEVLEWLDDNGYFDFLDYDDDVELGEVYEQIEANWDGRGSFSDIMTIDEFINEFESRYS